MIENSDKATLEATVEAIQDRKGKDIVLIDLSALKVSAPPYLVIAEGKTPVQVAAIADSVRDHLLETEGLKPINYTGYRNSTWIVLDYGQMMVHIFVPDARRFYNIEDLWADGEITRVPDLD